MGSTTHLEIAELLRGRSVLEGEERVAREADGACPAAPRIVASEEREQRERWISDVAVRSGH